MGAWNVAALSVGVVAIVVVLILLVVIFLLVVTKRSKGMQLKDLRATWHHVCICDLVQRTDNCQAMKFQ